LRPETGAPNGVEHFGIFALTGLAFCAGYIRAGTMLPICLVIFAGLVEISQFLVPGRHPRLSDFIVDSGAALIGAALILLVRQLGIRIP
jgi:VanZ family protein